jgi:zinc/manganese transport system permease protein
MQSVLHAIAEPGFFSSSAVHLAVTIGGLVAIVAAGVGVFTVIRGQAFAGEALGDTGAAGGSSAYLVGVGDLWGFVAISVLAASVMELIGVQRLRGRDLATGVVLGTGFGLAALFLYLGATYHNSSGATVQILFGSIFALSSSELPLVIGLAAITVLTLLVIYRPLLLASISAELAAARGVRVRLIGAAYLIAAAVTVALSAFTIGAILSTALLIGPAATALRLTRRPGRAILAAAAIGLACTWIGLLLSYDSYDWTRHHDRAWPASFFIVTLVLISYVGSGALASRAGRARSAP